MLTGQKLVIEWTASDRTPVVHHVDDVSTGVVRGEGNDSDVTFSHVSLDERLPMQQLSHRQLDLQSARVRHHVRSAVETVQLSTAHTQFVSRLHANYDHYDPQQLTADPPPLTQLIRHHLHSRPTRSFTTYSYIKAEGFADSCCSFPAPRDYSVVQT